MILRSVWIGGVLSAVMLFSALPALTQSLDAAALMDRIERLERDIRTLNVQIARGDSATGGSATGVDTGFGEPAYARLSVQMSQLENDLRNVTGRIEEVSFQVNQVSAELGKLVADVDFRLSQLEHGSTSGGMQKPIADAGAAVMPRPTPGTATPQNNVVAAPDNTFSGGVQVLGTLRSSNADAQAAAPASQSKTDTFLAQLTEPAAPASASQPLAAPSPGSVNAASAQQQPPVPVAAPTQTAALPDATTPREKYTSAYDLLRQGEYDMASSALRQFIEQHNDDPLVSNARYWLGETHYVRKEFVKAAEIFIEGYQTDPQGSKAPDALLKLGMSLSHLQNQDKACAAFQKLRDDYPDISAGLKSTLQREWQNNGCV